VAWSGGCARERDQDSGFGNRVREVHLQFQEESVKLRFRQRVGRFKFQWIQGRKNDERLFEFVGLPSNGDRLFLHRFEQSRLGLGSCAVDFVRKNHVRKDGARLEIQVFFTRFAFTDDVGTHDVCRHQVRCELDSRRLQMERVAERLDELRLAESRHAFKQDMSPREHSHQHIVDDVPVANDDLGDLSMDSLELTSEGLQMLLIQLGNHGQDYTAN
jgi:hypothetical protein